MNPHLLLTLDAVIGGKVKVTTKGGKTYYRALPGEGKEEIKKGRRRARNSESPKKSNKGAIIAASVLGGLGVLGIAGGTAAAIALSKKGGENSKKETQKATTVKTKPKPKDYSQAQESIPNINVESVQKTTKRQANPSSPKTVPVNEEDDITIEEMMRLIEERFGRKENLESIPPKDARMERALAQDKVKLEQSVEDFYTSRLTEESVSKMSEQKLQQLGRKVGEDYANPNRRVLTQLENMARQGLGTPTPQKALPSGEDLVAIAEQGKKVTKVNTNTPKQNFVSSKPFTQHQTGLQPLLDNYDFIALDEGIADPVQQSRPKFIHGSKITPEQLIAKHFPDRQTIEKTASILRDSLQQPKNKSVNIPSTHYVFEQAGFNGKPKVVDDKEFGELIEDGHIEMFRGMEFDSEEKMRQAFNDIANGDHYIGKGFFGNGTYVGIGSQALPKAMSYAGRQPDGKLSENRDGTKVGSLVQVTLDKSAKGIDEETLSRTAQELGSMYPELDSLLFHDVSQIAALMGYDYIIDGSSIQDESTKTQKDAPYMIILNRSKIIYNQNLVVYPKKDIKENE